MKIILLCLFTLGIMTSCTAQVVTELKRVSAKKKAGLDSNGWKRTGLFIFNMNQSSQSDWGSGGENFQLGVNTILNKAIHHKNGKYSFDSYFDLELGIMMASSYKKIRKTTDRFDLTIELDHSIGKKNHFNYGILANINTQVFGGHSYATEDHPKISSFLSPGKTLLSVGMDYKDIKPNSYFSLFLSPATIRWVTKMDVDFYKFNKFGVDSFQKVYTEMGAYLSIHYNAKISKTVKLISRFDLISNYKRNPANIDLLMNNVITFGIAKNFVGSFLLDILYDDDVKRRTQIQQVMGLGLRLTL